MRQPRVATWLSRWAESASSFVSARRSRRQLDAQVPVLLEAIARSLRAGRSLVGALGAACGDIGEPLGLELRGLWLRIEAGVALRDALADAAATANSAALRTVFSALAIANESGGAQAMVFDALASSMRSRHAATRELRALTTPVRVSALVIGFAPIAVLGGVLALDPATLSAALSSTLGWVALSVGLVLDAVGVVWIRALTRFEL